MYRSRYPISALAIIARTKLCFYLYMYLHRHIFIVHTKGIWSCARLSSRATSTGNVNPGRCQFPGSSESARHRMRCIIALYIKRMRKKNTCKYAGFYEISNGMKKYPKLKKLNDWERISHFDRNSDSFWLSFVLISLIYSPWLNLETRNVRKIGVLVE